ncbi:MAG: ABC-F family ATP-binding cassette domain-containing protein [Candidatus Cloacimonetes bacterium]|nr:ABC-F family ATP-binding cassette domain-containing protein [Candidatus Cloacimonadota bacterium]
MSIVSLSGISHDFGVQTIFDNMSFSLEKNSKIGLVGKNGSGKSTLFNLITGKLQPEEGQVHRSKSAKIAYLTQEPELDDNLTLEQSVLESRADYVKLSKQLQEAENLLSQANTKENLAYYSNTREQFEAIDGYHFRTEMKLVLTGLNFPQTTWDRKILNFSGGEKTRIQLAKILLQPFDIILLDEPTNHLDIDMIYWLENYLANLGKPYMIISHDRLFLDKTVTKIAEIKGKSLEWYKGNYSFYLKERQERQILNEKLVIKQQRQIKKMEDQIKQYRIWGRARDSEVMFKRAKELEKRLDKIDAIEVSKSDRKINLNFANTSRSGNDVFVFENMKFGFEDLTLAKEINLRINFQDRIAVLGKNGCGKTTLLKLMNGKLKPLSGIAKKGASLKIGYYDQMHLILDNSLTIQETIWQLAPLETRGYVLSYLARFGFTGDDVEKSVSILSGGEKARLYLAKLIHDNPNFLILDEPTNHLDINMISYLEAALAEFNGTIIFVSHDRYFIEKVSKQKWIFADGTINETEEKLEALFFKKKAKKQSKLKTSKPANDKKNKTNPFVLKKLHTEIENFENILNSKKESLTQSEAEFANPKTFKNQKLVIELTEKMKVLKAEISKLEESLDELETEYLELSM